MKSLLSFVPRLILGVALVPLLAAAPPEKPAAGADKAKVETFKGKVVPLADLLKKHEVQLDADAAPHWLALETEDGNIYPLIKDTGGRTFYRDAHLLGRPMQIQGRLIPGTNLLQVLQVYSVKNGQLHEVYYWCDVCSIKRYSLEKSNVCECCGGPMERREVQVLK